MTPDHERRAVDSALNGDEPDTASDAPPRAEPNGSEQSASAPEGAGQDPREHEATPEGVAEAATEPEAPLEVEQLAEPEPDPVTSAAEPEAVEVVPEPLVDETPAEEPAAQDEPAPESEPIAAEPEPVVAQAEPVVAEPAPEPEPEPQPVGEAVADAPEAAEPAPVEEPTGIAADIERALQAAAAPEPEPEPEAPPEPAPVVAAVPEAPLAEAAEAPEPAPSADGAEAEEEEDAVLLRAFQPGDWFVVHTYAGYENKVKTNLESRISSMNVEEKIFEVVIPMEDVMEIKSGKKQVVQRKVFPGYLLVRMDLDDDSWYVVRNTPGVTGFVGSGARPIPLSEKEVDRILQRKAVGERPKPKLEWAINDPVRVTTGPFANFQGLISEIDTDRSKLKVLVNIFGRETPVELGFDQVAKV
jgi:transcription termination/antitermination protein NusG